MWYFMKRHLYEHLTIPGPSSFLHVTLIERMKKKVVTLIEKKGCCIDTLQTKLPVGLNPVLKLVFKPVFELIVCYFYISANGLGRICFRAHFE